jgi:hypothetical protein
MLSWSRKRGRRGRPPKAVTIIIDITIAAAAAAASLDAQRESGEVNLTM